MSGARWFLCQMITVRLAPSDAPVTEFRAPAISEVVDPARGKPYQFTLVAENGALALVLVRGEDFEPLATTAGVVDLFGVDAERVRTARLGEIARGPAAVRLAAQLMALGVQRVGPEIPVAEVINALAARLGGRAEGVQI